MDFVEWLARNAVPFVLVFTKTDRGTPETVAANIAAFTARIAGWFEQLPAIYSVPPTTGHGRSELLGVIGATWTPSRRNRKPSTPPRRAPLPPEIEPPFRLKVRAGNAREEKSAREKGAQGRASVVTAPAGGV